METLNYSVKPMIDSFNFDEFLNLNRTSKRKLAFLVVTAKQLIYGYTKNYGLGSHDGAVSNAVREAYNRPLMETEGEQFRISEAIKKQFITAHFANEPDIGVYLAFYFQDLKAISLAEFTMFEQFYYKYNDTIYNYSKTCGHPIVTAVLPDLSEPVVDEFGYESTSNTITSNDLSDVLKFLKKIVSNKKSLPEDQKIIGETLDVKKR